MVEVAPEFRGLRRHLALAPTAPGLARGWGWLPSYRPICGLVGGLTMRTAKEWRALKGAPLEGWQGRPLCPRCAAMAPGFGASAPNVQFAG